MTIYRCDKCGKEVSDISDLYRIRAVSEWYDDSPGEHCWNDSDKTQYFDVCPECRDNVLWLFFKQFNLVNGAE